MNKWGALAQAMLSGAATVIIWRNTQTDGGVFGIYELLPGFIVALLLIFVVSLMTRPPSQEIVTEFETVKTADLD